MSTDQGKNTIPTNEEHARLLASSSLPQSPPKDRDSLDKIVDSHLQDIRAGHDSKLKEQIQAWHRHLSTKEMLEILDTIGSDKVVTTKYGYHSEEKKYGYRIAITELNQAINARKEH